MRYKADDPQFENYKVELDGVIQEDAIEADDEEGWVRVEKKKPVWFGRFYTERKVLYGRVFIVRYEGNED